MHDWTFVPLLFCFQLLGMYCYYQVWLVRTVSSITTDARGRQCSTMDPGYLQPSAASSLPEHLRASFSVPQEDKVKKASKYGLCLCSTCQVRLRPPLPHSGAPVPGGLCVSCYHAFLLLRFCRCGCMDLTLLSLLRIDFVCLMLSLMVT